MYKSASCKACGACRKVCNHDLCKPYGRCILSCPENCLEITGRELVADKLAKELLLTAEVLGQNFGGFTFSRGEPLMQPDFLMELVQALSGFHLCMETSGFSEPSVFLKAAEKMDLVIMDLKLANRERHREYTGQYNDLILQNAKTLQKSGIPHLFRTPLIPNITDTKENLSRISAFIGGDRIELLPYNELAPAKYAAVHRIYTDKIDALQKNEIDILFFKMPF